MNFLLGLLNFFFSLERIGKGIREKRTASLLAGLLFAITGGIYFFLSVREGEIQIKFGADAEDDADFVD